MATAEQPAAIPPFQVTPRPNVFIGWDQARNYEKCWSGPEDSVGIIGPPRYGKSSGLVIPSVLWWGGPVVSTSTRGDILGFTGNWRRSIAQYYGGDVLIYDPFGSEYPDRSMHWSPLADCGDPSVCYRRVAAMTAAASQGMQDGDHWRSGAASILRGYFHAAALEGLSIMQVRRWLATQNTGDAAAILRMSSSPAAMWADDLDAMRHLGDRERGSFYSTARNTLEALSEPKALESCSRTDLNIDHFLRTSSSLFIIGPSHQQKAAAPLIAGLVDSIAHRAAELAAQQGGRLDPPLLLALDEVANIAPIESLPALVSEGGGRGIITMWATQSLAQLRVRYGEEQQASILAATTAKLIFGGLSNGRDLGDISAWAGEEKQTQVTFSSGQGGQGRVGPWGGDSGGISGHSRTMGREQQVSSFMYPALPVNAIQLLPPLHAWLFYRSDRPLKVETRPAGAIPEYQAIRGFTP